MSRTRCSCPLCCRNGARVRRGASLAKLRAVSSPRRAPWQCVTEQGGLTMEFVGDRVAKTSSKNFLFQVVNDGAEVLQFGKLGAGRYSLDFGYPITPMQAFGLFLCSFGWVGPTTA